MAEIYSFQIDKADASVETVAGKRHMTVRLFYPTNPQVETKRMPENLDRGIEVFNNLLTTGYSEINPMKPASAGSLYVTKDGKLIVNRRDKGAPSHPLYHSAYAGFAATREHVCTAEGLRQNGLRESSEEVLLITRDKNPWLVVPRDSEPYVVEAAKKLGIDHLPKRVVDVKTRQPSDRLEVYDEDGRPIFSLPVDLEFIYESQTSLNALWIRDFPLSSDEVLPVDAEGMMKGDKFIHFNRESYILDPRELSYRAFNDALKNPQVFTTNFEEVEGRKVPRPTKKTDYERPYLGPDKVEVVNPHVFAPEDLLRRTLDALGIEGFTGQYNWMAWERWIEERKAGGLPLVNSALLV